MPGYSAQESTLPFAFTTEFESHARSNASSSDTCCLHALSEPATTYPVPMQLNCEDSSVVPVVVPVVDREDVAVELADVEADELAELEAVVLADVVAVLDTELDAVELAVVVPLELAVDVAVDDWLVDAVDDALVVPVDVTDVRSQPRSSPDCRW